MDKRIAILTQPLIFNYGGLLQNYALQIVLQSYGAEAVTINRLHKKGDAEIYLGMVKQILRSHHDNKILSNKKLSAIYQNTRRFIDTHIKVIDVENATEMDLMKICENNFDAVIVGSDQVWRPEYSRNIYFDFFSFLEENTKIKKYSYAASFGTDNWLFSKEQTERCKTLIQKFCAVSVREDSGVILCNQHLSKEAINVLDPTLLVDRDIYANLCSNLTKIETSQKVLFTYVLDQSESKTEIVNEVVESYGYLQTSNQPVYTLQGNRQIKFNLDDFIYPSVEGWLKGFRDADLIITDSFHGTVFSIIFNKPFYAIINEERGASRFSSLLSKLGLENRLINDNQIITEEMISEVIDYKAVNSKLEVLKNNSLDFIKTIIS